MDGHGGCFFVYVALLSVGIATYVIEPFKRITAVFACKVSEPSSVWIAGHDHAIAADESVVIRGLTL
jgi:hypothetical protein